MLSIVDTAILTFLKTGNPLVDYIIVILLTTIVSYFINNREKWYTTLCTTFFNRRHTIMKIERFDNPNGNNTITCRNSLFISIRWYISKHDLKEGTNFEAYKHDYQQDILISLGKNSSTSVQWNGEKVDILYTFKREKEAAQTITTEQSLTLTYKGVQKNYMKNFLLHVEKAYEDNMKNTKWKQKIYNIIRDNARKLYWNHYESGNNKNFSNIIMKEDEKRKLINDVQNFLKSKEIYKKRGLAWTRGYIFHGKPGCGKTSLVKAISIEAKMDIYCLDLSCIKNDQELQSIFRTIPKETFVLFEDIDASSDIVLKRSEIPVNVVKSEKVREIDLDISESIYDKGITLSGLLNELDGIVTREGSITAFTTNFLNKLDPALIRAGRIDYICELGSASREEIVQCIELYTGVKKSVDDIPLEMGGKHTIAEICNMIIKNELGIQKDKRNCKRIL